MECITAIRRDGNTIHFTTSDGQHLTEVFGKGRLDRGRKFSIIHLEGQEFEIEPDQVSLLRKWSIKHGEDNLHSE